MHDIVQWIIGSILLLASVGVILFKNPVHASISFLLTLFMLAVVYLQLSAQFIAVMQILVYAGAILVIFMFVIVLFQDAHQQITRFPARSIPFFLIIAAALFLFSLVFLGSQFLGIPPMAKTLPEGYGTVQALGHLLYLDYFFPFEAVIFLFLIAVIGALYIAKKVVR